MDQESDWMIMTQSKLGLCESCRELKVTAYTDPVGREYCVTCFVMLPVPTVSRIIEYLIETIPFQVGDRVECRTAGVLYDGIGVIDQVSIEPKNFGTPAYPAFHVCLQQKAYPEAPDALWYMERQICHVQEEQMSEEKKRPEGHRYGDEDDDETSQVPAGDPAFPTSGTIPPEWDDTADYPEV